MRIADKMIRHSAGRVLIHYTARGHGGVETHAFHLAVALIEFGYEVTVTSQRELDLAPHHAQRFEEVGVSVIAPPPSASKRPTHSGLVAARLGLVRRLDRRSFDVVIGQGHGGALRWMRRFLRPGGVLIWHEYWYGVPTRGDDYEGSYATPRPAPLAPSMMRMIAKVDQIVTGCERARRNLVDVQRIRTPIEVIPPLDDFGTPPAARDRTYAPDATVQVGFIGRQGRGKGTLALLDAWPRVGAGPAELHLHGRFIDDEVLARARTSAARDPSIHIHGIFGQADLVDILDATDLGLMISIEEGYGLTACEYLAHGVPLLMTDVGASAEIAAGPDALVIPVGPDPLRRGLEEMIVRVRSGSTSRTRAQRDFMNIYSFEDIRRAHVDLVDGHMRSRPNVP